MTPRQLSNILRRIAARIDNSKNPSKTAVSAELQAIVFKIAGRTDVVNAVDRAFNAKGVYPPVMKQTGPNTYEGEIDTGWDLKVVENSPGVMDVYLNNERVNTLKDAIERYEKLKNYDPDPTFLNVVKNMGRIDVDCIDDSTRVFNMTVINANLDDTNKYEITARFEQVKDEGDALPPFELTFKGVIGKAERSAPILEPSAQSILQSNAGALFKDITNKLASRIHIRLFAYAKVILYNDSDSGRSI